MKIKAKSISPIGFINNTKGIKQGENSLSFIENEAKRVTPLFYKEKGITLIALIIMVILLIILATVSIKGLTGKEGIFATSSKIGNEHIIVQYGEQVEQLANSIILKDSLKRKDDNNWKYGRRNGKRRLDKYSRTER